MKNYFICAVLFLLTLNTYPLSKPNHEEITICAINLLNCRYPNLINEEQKKLILKGNLGEDRFRISRLWNQHFYNPLKSKELWSRCHSIDTSFCMLVEMYLNATGNDRYTIVGALLHHIQDATSPSHVVPIYHLGKDVFDKYRDLSLMPVLLCDLEFSRCTKDYINSLFKNTAIRTLHNIKQRFEVKIVVDNMEKQDSIDWSYFWTDNPHGWFGVYGKHVPKKNCWDNFLKEKIEVNDSIYIIPKAKYDQFYKQQVELAVYKTAEFIYSTFKVFCN